MSFSSADLDFSATDKVFFGRWGAFGVGRELKLLPDALRTDENVLALAKGKADRRLWLLAVTDQRLILLFKGLLYGRRQLETPLSKIRSVSWNSGLIYGDLFVDTGAGAIVLEGLRKNDAPQIAAVISEALRPPAEADRRPAEAGDVVDQLEKLAALKERGALSLQEYLVQKKKLLLPAWGPQAKTEPAPRTGRPEADPRAEPRFRPDRAETGPPVK
ncbi:MAG: PH domain-containing protein [Deltaproteobacteria bacterium]|jgi:hypothetical protein|nr:PH domain-containing protein [Deltaproteobacteria bacterium]